MSSQVRLDLVVSDELDAEISAIAREAKCSRADVLRRGLAVMKVFQEQRRLGRRHLGFVADPSQLDAEVINVL